MRMTRHDMVMVAALVVAIGSSPLRADDRAAGHWEGAIELPTGELQVKVDLEKAENTWQGTIDIPAQAAHGLSLEVQWIADGRAVFSISGVPGNPTFDGVLTETEISGSFTQGGATFPFRLGRETMSGPARPQEPKEPFPYRAEDVRYPSGDLELAGTLTLPEGEGPFPGVVLISGSGPQNRNEEVFDHKPFLVMADHLTRSGIAVLRSDDRGVGDSTGDHTTATTLDFAVDTAAGVAYLKGRREIDAARIGLLGHSEGGLVAPLVASDSDDVAFMVLLAAPGVPGGDILPLQVEKIALVNGAPQQAVEMQVSMLEEGIELLRTESDEQALRARLRDLQIRGMKLAGLEPGTTMSQEEFDAAVEGALDRFLSPWFRFFLVHDPRPALREIQIPVLALNGDLDLQVVATQNLSEIERVLEEAGNPDVTARAMSGLNHLFQTAETGSPSEYYEIEETIAQEALLAISEWIDERFGQEASGSS